MADIRRWAEVYHRRIGDASPVAAFLKLMTWYPEFRNLFYRRVGSKGRIFAPLCRPMPTLYIYTKRIGPGLFIHHGVATLIGAKEIGANCWINQQVSIGFTGDSGSPTLEDNVFIGAGAKVLGDVTIGANSRVGANAVVLKNVPPDVTVVGVPAYIVKRNGQRVTEPCGRFLPVRRRISSAQPRRAPVCGCP